MDYLARREYSVFELVEKLKSLGHDGELVVEVVDALQTEKLVDDQRFCESLTRSRVNRGQGPLRILRDLRQKGVDAATVDEAVNANDQIWIDRLARVHERKYGDNRPASAQEWAKRARFLASRGFTSEQIRAVLDSRFDPDDGE